MIREKLTIVILNCTIIFLAGAFCAFGHGQETELKGKKITIHMDKQPLRVIFKHLIENYDVAIGFEQSTLDREHNDYDFETNVLPMIDRRAVSRDGNIQVAETEPISEIKQHWITVNVKNGRLEKVLNIIIEQMENYKWEINDGVVNIFPIQGRDKRYEKLLELNVKSFTLKKPIYVGSIRNNILALAEVINFLDENKLYSTAARSNGLLENLDRRLDVEMNFSNLTFRELLNKITKIKRGGWILQENAVYGSKEREYIEVDI